MKRKYIIIIVLIILILIVASILLYIKNKNQELQNAIKETNTITTNSNNTTIDESENQETQETGGSGEEYSIDHIKSFDFTILGLTSENTSKIQDVEDFKTAIKEYAYTKGLTNADKATLISTAEQGNILQYVFELTEDEIRERGVIIAHINIKTNKYNFGHKE